MLVASQEGWQEIDNQLFAVLGMVTQKEQARTAGIVYVQHEDKLYRMVIEE